MTCTPPSRLAQQHPPVRVLVGVLVEIQGLTGGAQDGKGWPAFPLGAHLREGAEKACRQCAIGCGRRADNDGASLRSEWQYDVRHEAIELLLGFPLVLEAQEGRIGTLFVWVPLQDRGAPVSEVHRAKH
eukprot:583924-Prymnesium_polylepis.2